MAAAEEIDLEGKFETLRTTVASLREKIVRSRLYSDQKDLHGPIQWGFADILKLVGDLEVEMNKLKKASAA
ncbi:MAG: hypothetical protein K8I02_09760 [Candidatus Methylomirabilis sp.]|nr:hypothetical protein [Deltaproteobacteria bacterium]